MTKARPIIPSMNGGEVDRETIARSDMESYSNKAQVMENALPGLKGGMYRAPGSRFLGFTSQGPGEDSAVRVRTWRYARSQAFTVELAPGALRLMFGIGFVQVGGGDGDADGAGWVDDSTGGASTDPNAPPWQPPPEPLPPTGGGGGGMGSGNTGGGGVFPPEDTDPRRPGFNQPEVN